jgi:hypothetical protein
MSYTYQQMHKRRYSVWRHVLPKSVLHTLFLMEVA